MSDETAAIEDIKRLKARYYRCMDTKQWDGWNDVFAPDATLDTTEEAPQLPVIEGRQNIIEFVSGQLEGVTTTGVTVDADDDIVEHGVSLQPSWVSRHHVLCVIEHTETPFESKFPVCCGWGARSRGLRDDGSPLMPAACAVSARPIPIYRRDSAPPVTGPVPPAEPIAGRPRA